MSMPSLFRDQLGLYQVAYSGLGGQGQVLPFALQRASGRRGLWSLAMPDHGARFVPDQARASTITCKRACP
ncbi:hypothetical protein HNQ51_001597 [Inhella inkyongensis]|uniref:Uncharacterized protein n=1 Tax=Inhella inkyongensis TaxID=392593 RepID=A0A840S3H9_9BURK|nr:hypothetical protein [Inhella inkyongensis]